LKEARESTYNLETMGAIVEEKGRSRGKIRADRPGRAHFRKQREMQKWERGKFYPLHQQRRRYVNLERG